VLEGCQARVDVADCVAEALELIGRAVPDIVVSDIGMPREDGYDLIREVRNLPPDRGGSIPAIALTAFARSEDRQRALRAGYQMHISKPLEPAELVAAIKSLTTLLHRPA
jgi:CheY-like chemotaxis protein